MKVQVGWEQLLVLPGLLVERIWYQLQVAGRLRRWWWVQWLSEGRCVRLAGRSYAGQLGMVGGFGAGIDISESMQLPVQRPVELLPVRVPGDSRVALAREVVRLWLEA